MRINEVLDKEDISYRETAYYKEYGAGKLFVGVKNYSGVLSYEGFHEYRPKTRKPVDTHIILHNLTNHLSKEMMGLYIRSGIFSSKGKEQAELFGDILFRIIPNDGYDAYYNPTVKDFTVDTKYKKQTRGIMYNLIKYSSGSDRGSQIKHMKKFVDYLAINSDNIDYNNFVESVQKMYTNYCENINDKSIIGDSEEIIKDVFQGYYMDAVDYIKGMEKISDFEKVKAGYEIIIFPHSGFWFI